MQLKSLTMNGFKSFADKTTLHFSEGMTGVIGPNGSGKSNITEAIRWAMGEQSAKSLRGERMPDVIFAGTALRKPLNRAEVTLTFDNSDHYFPKMPDEVTVTRRLFRNGESEFYLNQKACRLRDIVDLFMDSGLGRESFSIISQGRVEEIFNSKPENRRGIIEEAAGVLKYKQKKKQAEKELAETSDNLARVYDIVHELEDQIGPLQEQSSIATDYLRQKKDYDALYQQLLTYEITDLAAQQTATQRKADELKATVAHLKRQVAHATTANQQNKDQQQQLTTQLDQQQEQLLQQTQLAESLVGQDNVVAERQKNNQSQLDQVTQQLQTAQKQLTATQTQVQQLQTELTAKQAALAQHQQEAATLTKAQAGGEKALRAEIERLRSVYIDQMEAQTNHRNELSYAQKQVAQLTGQLSRQNQADQQTKNSQQALTTKQQDLKKETAGLKERVDRFQQELQKLQQTDKKLRQSEKDEQNKYYQALGVLQQAQAKQKGLAELADEHAGYYQGTKAVLQHQQELSGVLGAVADLLTVPREDQLALETALGGQLQNVVTTDESAAQQAIEYLKAHRLGRATFLPLSTMRPRFIRSSAEQTIRQQEGFQGIASELVQYDSQFKPVIEHLLGNLLVIDTLQHGVQLAQRTHHEYRIVTLAGDLLNPGGSMTGGRSQKQRTGLLERQQNLTDLNQMIAKMQGQLDQQQNQLTALRNRLGDNEQQQADCQKQLEPLQAKWQERQNDLTLAEQQVSQLERTVQGNLFTQRQQQDELEAAQQKAAALAQTTDEVAQKLAAAKQNLADANSRLDHFADTQKQAAEQLQQLQTENAVAKSEVAHVQEQAETARQQQDTLQQQVTDLTTQQQQLQTALKQSTGSTAERAQQLQTARTQIAALKKAMAAAKAQRTKLQAEQQDLDAQLQRHYALQENALDEQKENSIQLDRLKSGLDRRLATLRDQYELSYEAAQAQQPADWQPHDTKEKLKLLKRGLDDLGDVNLNAIDDYKRVKKRYDFLTQQQNDLLDAQKQLQTTMDQMDTEVAHRFKETFDATAQAFNEIFPLMFGGGHATLTLTDPSHLLTTGIEITAQPPGKKLQRLSLLSGGERALTAITLLFAILRVRPVPFCILDEVEASLDDANVARFGQFIKHFEQDSQFIVITHRKGTMTAADRLYGITMEESGISKVVAVSLENESA
ncbi:chromosome segregation protein SMC [Lactobacillus selangorensis]|uniref:Chromosome partition protein Smc n=1 Tax=Lactobacillus selangorensis TaxID=81857 RepID=A0A0R2FZ97_9LACO|nr:chromosome segregation protein SMC [Lactobacillus selangorensis]KRN29632.1 chromosome segregation protein SMC [Lactobacillus selangorensis]KRN33839.1 chromosome segregation protein SMC [Lactobacillus selangorensis]